MTTNRSLAAIMFTDIQGFTRSMQESESKAAWMRGKHLEVVSEVIAKYDGKLVQHFGDGTLSTFNSTVNAALAAVEIQLKLSSDFNIPLRIGLHQGDIVRTEDQGIYGDCVNIASRIQELAVPGSVFLTRKILDEVRNQSDFKWEYLGEFRLKNVTEAVEIFALAMQGLKVPSPNQINGSTSFDFRSVAVLPFANIGNDTQNEHLCDGITESILANLAQNKSLKVISRTSSFAFKNKLDDIKQIGEKLNSRNILEGSVQKWEDQIRVSVKLINVKEGYTVWSQIYNRTLDNIFSLQDDIAGKVLENILVHLSDNSRGGHEPKPTRDMEAYNAFLKGKYQWNKWTLESLYEAISYFMEAIKIDDEFAEAYALLSSCYAYLGSLGHKSKDEAYQKALTFANKALDLDNNLVTAHIALAWVKLSYELNWTGAGISYRTARRLNPGLAEPRLHYSWFLSAIKKHSLAIEELKTALTLDPLNLIVSKSLGDAYFHAQRYEEAIQTFKKTIDLEPTFRSAWEMLAFAYAHKGDFDKAVTAVKEYYRQAGHPLKGVGAVAYIYGLKGDRETALRYFEKLQEKKRLEPSINLEADFATFYMGLGEQEKALVHIEKGIRERMGVYYLRISPVFKPLWGDERYEKLFHEIQYSDEFMSIDILPSSPKNDIIINAETNDQLEMNPERFLYAEAQANYTVVYWNENNAVRDKLLRLSITALKEQLGDYSFIVKCHRSFLVNRDLKFDWSGNSRGYKVKCKRFGFEVPVSAAYKEGVEG